MNAPYRGSWLWVSMNDGHDGREIQNSLPFSHGKKHFMRFNQITSNVRKKQNIDKSGMFPLSCWRHEKAKNGGLLGRG